MEEEEHIISILESTKQALQSGDAIKLKELSNQTIHSASIKQDTGSITLAVMVYTISKILERKDSLKIKNWDAFALKLNSFLTLAVTALLEHKDKAYLEHLERIRKTINSISINLKPYVEEVMRKASINKATKIYEHGISMGQTAKLLGITQWEISEYAGQTNIADADYNASLDIRKRAQMAMEFFK